MKTNHHKTFILIRPLAVAAVLLLAGLGIGTAQAGDEERKVLVITSDAGGDAGDQTGGPQVRKEVVIRTIEPENGKQAAKKLTWLGVSVEEVPEALSAQLDLKSGEGLLVNYVSSNSPAAKAELQKNDVLVEFGGQMLVDSVQLRKLVQMHPEGDDVKITFYRGGKKHSVTAKLVLKTWSESSLDERSLRDGMRKLQLQLGPGIHEHVSEAMNALSQSWARAGLDKEKMNVEIERTMKETRKAIQDALKQAGQSGHEALGTLSKELDALAGGGVDVEKDATVVVKCDGKSVKTLVETDETGAYIIVADPAKHLTAHDKDGKLLFDGPIESPEQQKKVPKEVWEKIKPLLEKMDQTKAADVPELKENEPKDQKP